MCVFFRLPKSSKFFVHKQLLIAYVINGILLILSHDDLVYRYIRYKVRLFFCCMSLFVFDIISVASVCTRKTLSTSLDINVFKNCEKPCCSCSHKQYKTLLENHLMRFTIIASYIYKDLSHYILGIMCHVIIITRMDA